MMRQRPEPLPHYIANNLAVSGPIVNIEDIFEDGQISLTTYLDSPLCTPPPPPPTLDLATIATTLGQMSFIIEKEAQCLEKAGSADDLFTQSLTSRLEKHYGRLCADSGEFMPNAPLQDVLNSSGLSAMFPKVMERLELSCNTSINSDSDGDALEKLTPFKDYLQHMAHLQQVVAMAQQLQEDVGTANHKYMAHQIALLYQGLSAPGFKTLPYKKRIEQQFDDIKKTTEQAQVPQLNERQKVWLQETTAEVLAAALDLAGPASAPLHPFLHALAN